MSKDELDRLERIINPKFDLNSPEGVKGFLAWLFSTEVDKAFEQYIEATSTDTE